MYVCIVLLCVNIWMHRKYNLRGAQTMSKLKKNKQRQKEKRKPMRKKEMGKTKRRWKARETKTE